jgi:hypothetical protein
MTVHGRTWTSGVACASVSLPLRDQLRSRGYARPKPGLSTDLLITSPSINGFSAPTTVRIRAGCLRVTGQTGLSGMQLQPLERDRGSCWTQGPRWDCSPPPPQIVQADRRAPTSRRSAGQGTAAGRKQSHRISTGPVRTALTHPPTPSRART